MPAVVTSMTYEGRPMAVLHQLIQARQKWLRESVKDAVVASAISVVTSLRADTRRGKLKAKNADVEVTDTGYVGGWKRVGGRVRRVVRDSSGRSVDIHPVNRAGQRYVKGERIKVFKVVPVFHRDDWKWEKNRNRDAKCWYVFARSVKIARDFGKERVSVYMGRWRNLARLALGYAMAKISTRGTKVEPSSAKARAAADSAAIVLSGQNGGDFSMTVKDMLEYSAKALKSGPGGVNRAVMKASNSIAGRLRKAAAGKLDAALPTPFPEVKGRRR